jgi:hypothetical protein
MMESRLGKAQRAQHLHEHSLAGRVDRRNFTYCMNPRTINRAFVDKGRLEAEP